MKLRTKNLLIILAIFGILSLLLSQTVGFIVTSSYVDLEKKIVSQNVDRVMNQINQECSNLRSRAWDWSVWDDTYSFVNDTNEDYIQWNLQYDSFYNIKINFMIFYNNSGTLVFSKGYDLNEKNETHFPDSLYSFIYENRNSLLNYPNLNFFNSQYVRSGIIVYDENKTPVIVSTSPILHTSQQGPCQGTLIVGIFLDQDKINSIKNITQLNIAIHPLSNQPSIDFQQASSYLKGTSVYVRSTNSTYVAGYFIANDIVGQPAFIVEVGSNRDVYNQGLELIQNFNISLTIIMICSILIIILILDRFVTFRLTSLTKSVSDIKNYNDLSKQLQVKGNDEIANLEKNINDMLSSLQKTWAMKDSAEFSLQKKIDELERFKAITIEREMKMIDLKKQINELKAKTGERNLNEH
jgi:sensor domain CHASE-containing protein